MSSKAAAQLPAERATTVDMGGRSTTARGRPARDREQTRRAYRHIRGDARAGIRRAFGDSPAPRRSSRSGAFRVHREGADGRLRYDVAAPRPPRSCALIMRRSGRALRRKCSDRVGSKAAIFGGSTNATEPRSRTCRIVTLAWSAVSSRPLPEPARKIWRTRPSRSTRPERKGATHRSLGASSRTLEHRSSHVVMMSHPKQVSAVIEQAAATASDNSPALGHDASHASGHCCDMAAGTMTPFVPCAGPRGRNVDRLGGW